MGFDLQSLKVLMTLEAVRKEEVGLHICIGELGQA